MTHPRTTNRGSTFELCCQIRSIGWVGILVCIFCAGMGRGAQAQTELQVSTLRMIDAALGDSTNSVRYGRLPAMSSRSDRSKPARSNNTFGRRSIHASIKGSPQDVGDTLSFNTPLPLANSWRPVNFTLAHQSDSLRIWVETTFAESVSGLLVDSLAGYLLTSTPDASINPQSGIIANNTTVFGAVPDIDGDDVLDVLWLDIRDDYEPGIRGFVPGLVAPDDYDSTSAAGRGNNRNILYLDVKPQLLSDFGSVRAVSATAAGVHQALVHLFYDADEEVFLSFGLQELAKTTNGFPALGADYLATPIEHNIGLLSWEGFVGDGERSSLFLHYLAERLGTLEVAGLTRDPEPDVASLATLAANSEQTLEDLVFDFHTANFVNDKTVRAEWGYEANRYANLPTQPTNTLDASSGSAINPVTNTLAPGAVQMLQWQNVRDLSITIDASTLSQRDRLRARAILDNIDGTRTVQELSIDDAPDLLSGSFDAATILLVQAALDEPPTEFSLRGSWLGTAYFTVNSIMDSGKLEGEGSKFFQLGPEWIQAVRFRRPGITDLAKLFIDPFFLNELADESGVIQGSPSDPRDLLIEFHRDNGGVPGEIFFSLEIEDSARYQPVVSDFFQFTTIDLAEYPELRTEEDIVYVALSDVGDDNNYLVMGLSTYTTENTSFLYGPFSNGARWIPIWDLVAGVSLQDRSIPIRVQFREGLPTGVEESAASIRSDISGSAYPNPASGQFVVEVVLDNAQAVEVTVVDLLGRVVARAANPVLPAGLHQIRYDVSDWASGMYLVKIAGERYQTTTRTIVAH